MITQKKKGYGYEGNLKIIARTNEVRLFWQAN